MLLKRFFSRLSALSPCRKIIIGSALFLMVFYGICLPDKLFDDPTATVLFDRNGVLLGAKIADDGQWRFSESNEIPGKLETAVIVFEDRYFKYHPGFNPVSIVRALSQNIRAGRIVQGGSTLTMQVIRLSRKGKPRTIPEKIIEIILATRLELAKTKEEILQLYCSHAPYGGNVVGLEAASWRYFGFSSHDLSWAEAALLAVLPNSPSLIHPGKNREQLIQKRNRLLDRLYQYGKIDSITCSISKLETIPEKPLPLPQLTPHLLNRIYKQQPGRIVRSSLDAVLQMKAGDIAEKYYRIYRHNEIHNLAVLIADVENGNVLAYIGNVNSLAGMDNANDVDIIISPRSTGSLLKPILFGAMLEDGKMLPGSLVPDIPVTFKDFSPRNYNQQFDGAVPAKNALSRSLNVPAVRMLQDYGVERFHHLLKQLGMSTLNRPSEHYGLSLILGGAEGKLWEMVEIYAFFSRILNHYGLYTQYFNSDFHDLNYYCAGSEKKALSGPSDQPYIFSASSVWSMYNAMNEVNRPDEEAGWTCYSSARRIAWKTGTSYGYRDGWAIGTTPEYVIGVWAGNADGEGRPGLTGIATAAPVMFELFTLLPGKGWFKEPVNELIDAAVCRKSGYRAGMYCDDVDTIKIPYTCKSVSCCPYHRLIHLSPDEKYRVNSNCEEVSNMVHKVWFVLPPVQEWYYKTRHHDYVELPAYKAGCGQGEMPSMELIYPRHEVRIYIPVQLDGTRGRVVFEVAHRKPETTVFWHLDDQFIRTTQYIHQLELLPSNGWHTLTLVDEYGETLRKKFLVIDKD
ncbi:MAG: penicillin-binding protein 1C [Bacteroidales bacterium]|nr:penicillin-binding protein 1C [Bacteroidales bacterium]MBN2764044.1 penicillin-binding protein 1C [Bacteroidales bacterium]